MLTCPKCQKEVEANPALGRAPGKFCDSCPDGIWQTKPQTSEASSIDSVPTAMSSNASPGSGKAREQGNLPTGTAALSENVNLNPLQLHVSLGRGDLKPGQQMVVKSIISSRNSAAGSCQIKVEYNEQRLQHKQIHFGKSVFTTLVVPRGGQHLLRFEVRIPGGPLCEGFLTFDCDDESGPKIVIREEVTGDDIIDGQFGEPIEIPEDFTGTIELTTIMNAHGDVVRTASDSRIKFAASDKPPAAVEQTFNVALHEVLDELSLVGPLPQQPQSGTITLGVSSPGSAARLVTLNAGTLIHVGRRPKRKPRVFLRNSPDFDPREYFRDVHSNHGFIEMTESGAFWNNGECSVDFTANYQGTLINNHRFPESGQQVKLVHSLEVTPCGASSDDQVPNAPNKDDYNLRIPRLRICAQGGCNNLSNYSAVAENYGFSAPQATQGPHSVVRIDRLGEVEGLESHVLLQNVAELGSDPTADIVIDGRGVQPFHATVVVFHGCFWIRPSRIECHVQAHDTTVQRNQLAWLKPGTVVTVGDVQVTVSEFRQHNVP